MVSKRPAYGGYLDEYYGLSTDTKPSFDYVVNGSTFVEIDTSKKYYYDAENKTWIERENGSGYGSGSGGSSGSGTEVVANPTLAGTESDLTGLQVGDTKYKVGSGGGMLVIGANMGTGVLDKTWQEIYDADYAVVVTEAEGSKYILPVVSVTPEGDGKMATSYEVVVASITAQGVNTITGLAESASDYPEFVLGG